MIYSLSFLIVLVFLFTFASTKSTAFVPTSIITGRTNSMQDNTASAPTTRRRSKRLLEESLKSSSLDDDITTKNPALSNNKLFTMGLLADIQYAPIPDGYSYSGAARYYRHALDVARHAAQHFQQEQVELVVNLGDIVDGKCQAVDKHGGGESLLGDEDPGHKAVDQVLEALSEYKGPMLHAYGNHCLYNLDREALRDKLGIPFSKEPCGDLVGYHTYSTNKGVRFVTLDSYDIAKMRRCEVSSQKRKHAIEILSTNNPNYEENENSPEGLVGVARRFVAFNGGVGQVQLQWLRETLAEARSKGEIVIILSHQPIHPRSTNPVCLMWNYKEVLAVLREYKDVVVASFAGHAHKGGYQRDRTGIHFRVFEAALENPDPYKTYAMIDVYDDHLNVRGFGNSKSAIYEFAHKPARQCSA